MSTDSHYWGATSLSTKWGGGMGANEGMQHYIRKRTWWHTNQVFGPNKRITRAKTGV